MSYEGAIVLNYRLVEKLGEGGFGTVYLAEHVEIGRRSACKILHREYASRPDVVDRFFREARAVCAIGHAAIIGIENFGRLPTGEPYFLMEYFPGEPLSSRVRRARLGVAEAIAVFESVADALAAAHSKGIIHRDLKPDNIMLMEEAGRVVDVRLLDFGIAKLVGAGDGISRSGTPMGTPAFMSPEQARDAKGVDVRTDVYSFAASIYAAFAGRPPFISESVAGTLLKVQTDPPDPLRRYAPSVPAALEAVLERCMDKQPENRPATIGDAWREIRAALRAPGADLGPPAPGAPAFYAGAPAAPATLVRSTLGGAAAEQTAPEKPGSRRLGRLLAPAVALVMVAAIVSLYLARREPVVVAGAGPDPTWDAGEEAIVPEPGGQPDAAAVEEPSGKPEQPDAGVIDERPAEEPQAKRPPRPNPPRRDPPKPDPPPKVDCSVASFARVYEKPSPGEREVQAALTRLRGCQPQLPPARFRQIQQNLVSKLL